MRSHLAIFTIVTLAFGFCAYAQHVPQAIQPDAVLDAIHEFNQHDSAKPKEVIAVLDDVGVSPVTGKPNPKAVPPAPSATEASVPSAPGASLAVAPPTAGLAVRVEKFQTTKGAIDPSTVKLLAPFPAKPLSLPPTGWHLDSSETVPPFTREVEVAPGSKVTLTIHPHVLVPDADGASVFAISEPGYDGSLGYRQTATVGAVLSTSLRQMEDESKQLSAAIDELEQLLISLPKPESQPELKTPATPPRKR